ncbi:MAG: hypothetical protein KDA28_11755 [Phycisphaerales bacterium]|nr:hypothetical protein [Phycisphaerales bacterium]
MLVLVFMLVPAAAMAQPSFSESVFIVPPTGQPDTVIRAYELCADEFRGVLLDSGDFVARNESEIESTVSQCTEDLSNPGYAQECMLNVSRAQVDWIFMLDLEDLGDGDVLLNGRGFQSATNAEVWSQREIVGGSDLRRVALEGCGPLAADFVASRAPDQPDEPDEPDVLEPDVPDVPDVPDTPDRVPDPVTVTPPVTVDTQSSCPWGDAQMVIASGNHVIINGQSYNVRGSSNRAQFESMLASCGLGVATVAFEQWRRRRRARNGMMAFILGLPYAWIPAIMAGGSSSTLEYAIMQD